MTKSLMNIIKWIIKYPYYKMRNNHVPISSQISGRVFLNNSKIGEYCYIGSNCDISYAEFGNYCCVANNVVIGGMEHPHWDISISPKLSSNFIYGNKTRIGHDVWIATGCIIRQGVTIGDGAVIGAGSFVNKDVEPYSVVVGTPAFHIKYRECKIFEQKLRESNYWVYNPEKAKKLLLQINQNK